MVEIEDEEGGDGGGGGGRDTEHMKRNCAINSTFNRTVNPIFLTVLYFSDLVTHLNLTPLIILLSKDNTHKIQYHYIIFPSLPANILPLVTHS